MRRNLYEERKGYYDRIKANPKLRVFFLQIQCLNINRVFTLSINESRTGN